VSLFPFAEGVVSGTSFSSPGFCLLAIEVVAKPRAGLAIGFLFFLLFGGMPNKDFCEHFVLMVNVSKEFEKIDSDLRHTTHSS